MTTANVKISQLPPLLTMGNATIFPVVDGGNNKVVSGTTLRTYLANTGVRGYTGSVGIGYIGSRGATGPSGPAGSNGATGATGATGIGATGSSGPRGYTGSAGTGGGSGNALINGESVVSLNGDGNLTIPGNIHKTTDLSIVVGDSVVNFAVEDVDSSTIPPSGVWRLFFNDSDYPTLGTTVQIGDTVTTSWGTPLTVTIVDIQQDSGSWQIHVDQDITVGFNNYNTVTFSSISSKTWAFGYDGSLTLPNGMSIDSYSTLGVNAVVSIGGDDTRITIDNDGAPPGFTITTNATAGMGQRQWRFGPDGDLTFPDGSIQTTAYTGDGGGIIGTFFVVANDDGTVSKSTDGVTWANGVDTGEGIDRVATDGVTVAMNQGGKLTWTTFAGLEESTYVSGSGEGNDQIGGQNISWNQIDYAGGYFVAVGSYTPSGESFSQGVYGYSTDGQSWTFATVDQTVVEFFGNSPVNYDWEFSDVDYNGVGWMFSVAGISGGGVYITDLTAAVTSARCFGMAITYKAAWNGSAWYMEGDDSIAGVNTSLDPRNGDFDGPIDPWATDIQDLGIDAGGTVELAGGNGYIAASDSDGHVAWSDDNGATWQIVTPIPYTRTISSITQASPAVVSFSGSGENGDTGEKVVISGSSVSGYNGTFYWEPMTSSLYTDQARTTEFDTTGLAPFTGTATLTWSNGQYIDAMDYINGYFYIGNDDEQIARTTNFVSWTIVDDQNNDFEYWNDIAGFVSTGGNANTGNFTFSDDTITNGAGLILETDRGTLAIGTNMETPGVAQHFHIAFNGSNSNPPSSDLFLGDDYNYVKLPGYELNPADHGVEIGTHDRDGGDSHMWRFGTDGGLKFPDGSIQTTAYTSNNPNVWVQTFESQNGSPTDIVSIANSVEYDSSGNVIALFSHFNDNDSSRYYSVGKYTTTGTKIWTTRFADGFQTDGWGLAVAGNYIYVAGQTDDGPGPGNSTLTKLDGTDGSIEWSKVYDFGYASSSNVVDVASDGNPVMVGYASNVLDQYVATTKVDAADGSIIWSRALNGQGDEEAYGMAVGPDGEVVAIGYMGQLGIINATATLYADPVSNVNWVTGNGVMVGGFSCSISVTDGVPSFSNVVDTTGGRTVDEVIGTIPGTSFGGATPADDMVVKVASVTTGNSDNRMLVVKYASDGTIAWQKAILFDAGFDCLGADADIDSDGNIYVTGSYQYNSEFGGTTSALSILKLDSTGVKQWSRRITGTCDTFGVSVVVGADDKLYLSAVTGFAGGEPDTNNGFTWVAAKYGFDGTVEWQRLIDRTDSWSFTGTMFFGDGGGSNLAVKDGYVVLGGGFGNLANSEDPRATVVQVADTGDTFSTGPWAFTAASFSGVLNSSASDITVTNALKTDTDNVSNISVATVTPMFDSSAFLLGTLYVGGEANNQLVNGAYSVSLGADGMTSFPVIDDVKTLWGAVDDDFVIKTTRTDPGTDADIDIFAADDLRLFAEGDELGLYANTSVTINADYTGSNKPWTFGTDGNLTLPAGGHIVDSTGASVLGANIGTLEPTTVDGSLWYDTTDGRTYVRVSGTWVDAAPQVLEPVSTYLGNLTIEDTTIFSDLSGWTFGSSGAVTNPVLTVADLPTPVAGMRAFVNDAAGFDASTAPSFGTQVTGAMPGYAFTMPVWSNGTAWYIG